MSERGQVNFVITAKDAASKPIGHINRSLGGLSKTSLAVSKTSVALGSAMGTMIGGVGLKAFDALASTMAGAFSELVDADKLLLRTKNVLKTTGNAANVTADKIAGMADRLEKTTGVEAEAIQNGENLLLTFTNLRNAAGKGNNVFDQTTTLMVDMASALGTDTSTAAMQLGKALNDPIRGVTALRRAGVSFSESQLKTIKRLQKSGDVLGAQKVILREVRKEFGGAGKAAGQSFAGQMSILSNTIEDLAKEVLKPLLPIIVDVGKYLRTDVLPVVSELIGRFTALGGKSGPLVADVMKVLRDVIAAVLPVVQKLAASVGPTLGRLLSALGTGLLPTLIGAFKKMLPIVGTVANFLTGVLVPALMRIVAGVVVNVLPVFQRLVAFFSERVIPAVSSLISWLGEQLTPIINKAADLITTKFLPVWSRVAGFIVDNILPAIADLVGWLWGDGKGPLAIAVGNITTFFGFFLDYLGWVFDMVTKVLDAMDEVGKFLGIGGGKVTGPTLNVATVPAAPAATGYRDGGMATLTNTTNIRVDLDGRQVGNAVSRYVGSAALADGGSRTNGAR